MNVQMDSLENPLKTRLIRTGWKLTIEQYLNWQVGRVDTVERLAANAAVLIWTQTWSIDEEKLPTLLEGHDCVNLEATIERVWTLKSCEFWDALGDHNHESFEMHYEAVKVGVWRHI
jgi:hypothetical protein